MASIMVLPFRNYKETVAGVVSLKLIESLPSRRAALIDEIFYRNAWSGACAFSIGLTLFISYYIAPIALAVGWIALRYFRTVNVRTEVINEAQLQLDRNFKEMSECNPAESLPFFEEYGRYCQTLEFPESFVLGIELKSALESISKKEKLSIEFKEAYFNKILGLLHNKGHAERESLFPCVHIVEMVAGVSGFFQTYRQRMKTIKEHSENAEAVKRGHAGIDEQFDSLVKRLKRAMKLPRDHSAIVNVQRIALILQACPNRVWKIEHSACNYKDVERKTLINAVRLGWEDQLIQDTYSDLMLQ